MRKMLVATAALAVLGLSSIAQATTTTVISSLTNKPSSPVAGSWYISDKSGSATASIVNLAGLGGNLENGQPSPTGAVKLTTTLTNTGDKVDVSTFTDFGLASTVLKDIELGYSYYKQYVAGANVAAAPSIKLTISKQGFFGLTQVGTLIYEPTWNGGNPTTDVWHSVSIDSLTGAGGDPNGGWWWNGGFTIAGSSAGPPIRSLSEWADAFTSADPTNFAVARVTAVKIGIGSWNQGQIDYFDNVSIKTGNIDTMYSFYPVPEPSSILALLGGLGSLLALRRRKA